MLARNGADHMRANLAAGQLLETEWTVFEERAQPILLERVRSKVIDDAWPTCRGIVFQLFLRDFFGRGEQVRHGILRLSLEASMP